MIKTQKELINIVSRWANANNNMSIHIKSEQGLNTPANVEDIIKEANKAVTRLNVMTDFGGIEEVLEDPNRDDILIIESADFLFGRTLEAVSMHVYKPTNKCRVILVSIGKRLELDPIISNRIMHLNYTPEAAV